MTRMRNDDCGMNGGKNKLDRKEIKERVNQFADCSEIKTQAMEPHSAITNPHSAMLLGGVNKNAGQR